jgi:glycerophosphoryl diester phosphodiesterase
VILERRTQKHSWRRVDSARVRRLGRIHLRGHAPAVGGIDGRFRVRATVGEGRVATRRIDVPVVAPDASVVAQSALGDAPLELVLAVRPTRASHPVDLQRWTGAGWVVVDTATEDSSGRIRVRAADAGSPPAWYRVRLQSRRGIRAVASRPFRVANGLPTTVVAHRGASGSAPENTVDAVRLAAAAGAGAVESDVQRTADGALVVVHDLSLERTTNVEAVFPGLSTYEVRRLTLAEIQSLDAGSWFDPRFSGAAVPTLEEWVRAATRTMELHLEVKSPTLFPGIGQDLYGALTRMGVADRTLVSSADHAWLRTFVAAHPDMRVAPIYGASFTPADAAAVADWASAVVVNFAVTSPDAVRAARGAGLRVHLWVANAEATMRRALRMGPDGLLTDFPDQLVHVLDPPGPPA